MFQKLTSWAVKHKWLTLVAIIVLIIGCFLLYRQYQIGQEKQRFEQARASIDALYAEIVKVAGEPDKTESSASCGYAERKFDRGPRSCGVSTRFAYGVTNSHEADEKFEKIKSALENSGNLFKITYTNEAETFPLKSYDESSFNELGISLQEVATSLSCSMYFRYGNTNEDWQFVIIKPADESLSTLFACSDDAKAEHYPVRKN